MPDGYLAAAYASVRAAGGLCIADEVQVGYGRLGDFFWGFQQQGVVPDIVTMAKCTGNGVPVGAVVTTRTIAETLRTEEGSFFSSMGGSPLGSVAALATIDTIVEGLQENAAVIGRHIADRVRPSPPITPSSAPSTGWVSTEGSSWYATARLSSPPPKRHWPSASECSSSGSSSSPRATT